MLVERQQLEGIDKYIARHQKTLHKKLCAVWEIDEADPKGYLCFPRCYRNQTDTGYMPELYLGNKEYKDSLLDDKVKVLSFYGIDVQTVIAETAKTTVHLIFFVNLEKIRPGDSRNDAAVWQDVYNVIEKRFYGFIPKQQLTGLENVLKEYSAARVSKGLKFRDMHPWHMFRFDFDLLFDYNKCDC